MPTPPLPTTAKAVEYAAAGAGMADQARDTIQMWKAFQDQMRLGKLYKVAQKTPGLSTALGAIEGSAKSIDDINNGQREKWMQQVGAAPSSSIWGDVGWDSLRTAEDIGNALTFGLAGRLGNYLSKTK